MRRTAVIRCLAVFGVAAFVPACISFSSSYGPDEPGLYAVADDGAPQRLDGDQEWEQETWEERSTLPPDLRFIVVHPALSRTSRPPEEVVHLRKVAWLRSEIDGAGDISPPAGAQWIAPEIEEFSVPLEYRQVDERPDLIEAVASVPLEPGLYSLQLRAGGAKINTRLGVHWDSVDRRAYSTANCVDRYAGNTRVFRPCAEQHHAMAGQGLQLHIVRPERQMRDGASVIVVKGVMVNVSDKPRPVPALQARLRGQNDETLHQWIFAPDADEVPAGRSIAFETETDYNGDGIAGVSVGFAQLVGGGTQ